MELTGILFAGITPTANAVIHKGYTIAFIGICNLLKRKAQQSIIDGNSIKPDQARVICTCVKAAVAYQGSCFTDKSVEYKCAVNSAKRRNG